MPYQISALQEKKLWNIMTGNIPTTAVADWVDHYRQMSMGSTSMDRSQQAETTDQYRKMRLVRENLFDRSAWADRNNDINTVLFENQQDRHKKTNREVVATEIFHRAVREGDWDTAKAMVDEYEPLRNLYALKRAYSLGFGWLVEAIQKEAAFKTGVQCVALIANIINAYINKEIYTGEGEGATGHGNVMLTKLQKERPGLFNEQAYNKFSDVTESVKTAGYKNLEFGDLIELPGEFGHVMMFIGYTDDGRMKFVETVGGVKKQETAETPVLRWSHFGPEMYQDYEGAKNLRQHVQIYNKNYLSGREKNNRGLTKVVRMKNLGFDTEQARELIEYMLPWEDENKSGSSGGLNE